MGTGLDHTYTMHLGEIVVCDLCARIVCSDMFHERCIVFVNYA